MLKMQQWPSLKERSGSLSLNLQQPSLALAKLLKPSNELNARARTILGVQIIKKNLDRFESPSHLPSPLTTTTMRAGKLQDRKFKFDDFKHLYFSCFHWK